ncbi:MAG: hypothetical protein JXA21_16470 [Anaerolineae bacterium]|nr:hypothetical protein [Anaerolineae bacterium]
MKRFKAFLRQPELAVFLYVLGILVFLYPALLMLEAVSLQDVMLAVYIPWGVITIVLIFMGRASFASDSSQETTQDEGGRDG